MVNYCCVSGCGRNSRSSQNLYYYSVPKETFRQEQWLKAAGRPELLDKPPDKRSLYRFCSRHFSPSSFKNKHLCADAVPTLCLPGSMIDEEDESSEESLIHQNIACDSCGQTISGFRYKCLTCSDYDLCSRCEMNEAHSQHYMLRIPTPNKSRKIERMVRKWQELYNNTYLKTEDSSDDEPITKYVKNKDSGVRNSGISKHYDSGVDLTEDVKEILRNEVDRVLSIKPDRKKKKLKRSADDSLSRPHVETMDLATYFGDAPEVVFADCSSALSVENIQVTNIKTEAPADLTDGLQTTPESSIPMFQMKPSDDLTELMMEVGDQKLCF